MNERAQSQRPDGSHLGRCPLQDRPPWPAPDLQLDLSGSRLVVLLPAPAISGQRALLHSRSGSARMPPRLEPVDPNDSGKLQGPYPNRGLFQGINDDNGSWRQYFQGNGIVREAKTGPEIEFLKPYFEENSFTSDNPAIFETEPKETAELELFYAASKAVTFADNSFIALTKTGIKCPCLASNFSGFSSMTRSRYSDPACAVAKSCAIKPALSLP